MELVKLVCGKIKRYAFIEKLVDKVLTTDYFEWDELLDDSPVWTKVYPISKKEYIANYLTILGEMEDAILSYLDDFSKSVDWENMTYKEFINAEHQYILAHIYNK